MNAWEAMEQIDALEGDDDITEEQAQAIRDAICDIDLSAAAQEDDGGEMCESQYEWLQILLPYLHSIEYQEKIRKSKT